MTEENAIDVVCERIKCDGDMLRGEDVPRIKVDSFNFTEFWPQFDSAVLLLSNEVTKVSFMCNTKPFTTKQIVNSSVWDILQYYNMMRDLYLVLPLEVGAMVLKAITTTVFSIMSALYDVVRSFSDLSHTASEERLRLIGTFWDVCSEVQSLPKDNLLATLNVLEEEVGLVRDAIDELNSTIEEEEDKAESIEASGWTDSERQLAYQSIGLVRVTGLCVQQMHKAVTLRGSCTSAENIKELDATVEAVRRVSAALDEFVSELYHPVNFSVAIENANKLMQVLYDMLAAVQGSHFEYALDTHMVNKLQFIISHNHCKIGLDTPLPEFESLNLEI